MHVCKLTAALFSTDCSNLIQGKRVADVANYLEKRCHCGISALYLQGEALSLTLNWKPSHLAVLNVTIDRLFPETFVRPSRNCCEKVS